MHRPNRSKRLTEKDSIAKAMNERTKNQNLLTTERLNRQFQLARDAQSKPKVVEQKQAAKNPKPVVPLTEEEELQQAIQLSLKANPKPAPKNEDVTSDEEIARALAQVEADVPNQFVIR